MSIKPLFQPHAIPRYGRGSDRNRKRASASFSTFAHSFMVAPVGEDIVDQQYPLSRTSEGRARPKAPFTFSRAFMARKLHLRPRAAESQEIIGRATVRERSLMPSAGSGPE